MRFMMWVGRIGGICRERYSLTSIKVVLWWTSALINRFLNNFELAVEGVMSCSYLARPGLPPAPPRYALAGL
jgi:hypothetical protein